MKHPKLRSTVFVPHFSQGVGLGIVIGILHHEVKGTILMLRLTTGGYRQVKPSAVRVIK